MLAARVMDLDAQGVALLGEVPQGLPSLGLPAVSRADLNELLPIALAGFVLGAVESSAIGRMFGQKHGYRFDANQELLAMGAGNLLSGLGRGFPVSGGMSQSLVNESAGARTPVSGLIAALFTMFVVLFASGLLRNLPQPVLAAIVLAAVMSLVKISALQHIWRFSRAEFFVAIAAMFGVLGSGPVNGVLLGAAISIVFNWWCCYVIILLRSVTCLAIGNCHRGSSHSASVASFAGGRTTSCGGKEPDGVPHVYISVAGEDRIARFTMNSSRDGWRSWRMWSTGQARGTGR